MSSVIFLSGDVHFTQVTKNLCSSQLGYNLLEVTSSGLTHSLGMDDSPSDYLLDMMTPERYRISELKGRDLNFGVIRVYKN